MAARAGLSTGWYAVRSNRSNHLIAAYRENRLARMRADAEQDSRIEWIADVWFIHKHGIALRNGGPEEGGWWFKEGQPVKEWEVVPYETEFEANAACWELNMGERERAKRDEVYEFTSAVAYLSQHYEYSVHKNDATPADFPEFRPHYE